MSERDVHIVIGAGLAGAAGAMAMRAAGFAGRIVLVGDEPHLPYDRPPLSKELLTAATPPDPALHPASLYADRAIELVLGCRAEEIDTAAQRVRLADGRALAYDRLLLATGGRARRLAVPGGEHALLLRTLDDARVLRRRLAEAGRVVVIGAGVIGLEAASAARARGCEVVVLEAADGAMRRVMPPPIAEYAEALHRRRGVELRFGVAVAAIEADGGYCVRCGDGETLAADLVVAGVGLERDLALAAAAGIAIERGGIAVDEFCRTSLPQIFAAGDVAAFLHPRLRQRLQLEHWKNALAQGEAAGRAMCGRLEPYDEVPWFWTDQHGVNFQLGGLPLAAEETVLRGDPAAGRFTAFHLAGGRLIGATTVDDGRNMRPALILIRDGNPVDAAALADPARPLRALLAR